jgi:hypothetical protein
MSGLMPQSTRRKIFRIASCSNTTLVLLCSASNTRGAASSGSVTSGSRSNFTGPTTASESIRPSRCRAADGSYSASYPVRSPSVPMVATALYSTIGPESQATSS